MARSNRQEMGLAIEKIERALDQYALAYLEQYGAKLGEDAVIGDAWARVLRGVIGLLDGETGQLDPGRAWHRLVKLGKAHGFSDRELGL